MNGIKFIKGVGGLGRPLAGEDHISGIVVEMALASIPPELVVKNFYATIYSPNQAKSLGIDYSGNGSNIALDCLAYNIDQIFWQNKKAVVHVLVAVTDDGQTVAGELTSLQYRADGKIRQALLLAPEKVFAVGDLPAIQEACDVLESEHQMLSVVYAPNFIGATISGDLGTLDYKNISIIVGMDGNGIGNTLTETYNSSFTAGGSVIGVLSAAKVHENIGWIERFNINDNPVNEFDVLKIADGREVKMMSDNAIQGIGDLGYIFLVKFIGRSGSFFNDSRTATREDSDYAYIESNRTIDKAVRNTRVYLLPSINSPLYVNPNGTLTEDTIAGFKNDAERALEDMQRAGEISAFSVTIDPSQEVLSVSKLAVSMDIVPAGVTRNIEVNIGLKVSLD